MQNIFTNNIFNLNNKKGVFIMAMGLFTAIIDGVRAGLNYDIARDVRWAKEGDVNAQVRLAYRFLRGDGQFQDNDEALKWFRRAAHNGSELAKQELEKLNSMGIY